MNETLHKSCVLCYVNNERRQYSLPTDEHSMQYSRRHIQTDPTFLYARANKPATNAIPDVKAPLKILAILMASPS